MYVNFLNLQTRNKLIFILYFIKNPFCWQKGFFIKTRITYYSSGPPLTIKNSDLLFFASCSSVQSSLQSIRSSRLPNPFPEIRSLSIPLETMYSTVDLARRSDNLSL